MTLQDHVEFIHRHADDVRGGNSRVVTIAEHFARRRTPFRAEALGAHDLPPPGIQLSSFDCATFIYLVNALAGSRSFEGFAAVVEEVRYVGVRRRGNLVHYTTNVIDRFVRLGILEDVTCEVGSDGSLLYTTGRLGVCGDGRPWISELEVGDRNIGEVVRLAYIPTDCVSDRMPAVRSGDTLLFVSAKSQAEYPGIIWHTGFAYREMPEGDLGLLHAGRTAVCVRGVRRAGVSVLREWDAQRSALKVGGPARTVASYLTGNSDLFAGVAVFRPCRSMSSY